MLISEEQVAALEAQIAELLGLLELLDEDGITDGIRQYAEQVGRVGQAADDAGSPGLREVCRLFQNHLAGLSSDGRGLSDAERERLEEWPILVMGCLGAPDDLTAIEPLIEHLSNPVWSAPLTAETAKALRALLAGETPTVEPTPVPLLATAVEKLVGDGVVEVLEKTLSSLTVAPAAPAPRPSAVETTGPVLAKPESIESFIDGVSTNTSGTERLTEVVAIAMAKVETETEAEIETEVEMEVATEAETKVEVGVAAEAEAETKVEVGVAAETETVVVAEAGIETEADAGTETETEIEVDAEVETAPEAGFEMITGVEAARPTWAETLAGTVPTVVTDTPVASVEEESAALIVATVTEGEEPETETAAEVEEWTSGEEDEDEELTETVGLGEARQELLDILSAEIAQIVETSDEILTLVTTADSAPVVRRETLSDYAERLERLGDASASIGLTGLQQVCGRLQVNLNQLAAQDNPLTAEQRWVVETWPVLALGYLQALDDRAVCTALVHHLQDTHWPQPLATLEAAPLIDLLVAPKLVAEEPEAEARPRQAQPEDVSLALPADVNQELLDGLLQELPHQAAEFSTAIQRLAAGDGQVKDVDVARRIAHTLKGAGNTVGVRGIATLTHHVEDILQALAKHGVLPNRPLAETLLNAADCLEAMSEALLGISAPPLQAPAVLQEVLDWANRIDRTGIPTDDAAPLPAATRLEPTKLTELAELAEPAPQPVVTAPEATLRIPAHLVDDVLRLVGESIILTGQVQERIRKTVAQTRAVMAQNRLFQQLTAELEQLVDIRNVSSPLSRSIQRGDFDPLELEQYNELNTVTHRLVEAATDTRELGRAIEENLAALDTLLVDQGRLHRDNQEAVLRTRMVPIQTVTQRLQRSVRQTCRLVDKDAELMVRGAGTLMDSNILNDMVDPLMHMLRNAVDHGIEPPAQRKRLGKPSAGRIELSFGREGNNIVVRCQDDGAGLDLAAIRRTAIARGLLAADQPLSDDELIRLILLPGFSTRDEATQTSGRGIGMDMIYSRLLAMKGSLRIQTQAGQGCLMELRLPVTLISTHALLVRLRDQMVALSDRGIEQILYSGIGTIQKLGKITTYQMGDEIYELTSLDALLNLPPDHRARNRSVPSVLLVREDTGAVRAVLVQEIIDSRDLVVKNLGQYIPRLNGIVGATILGDGSVAPVLDVPELLRAPTTAQPALAAAHATAPAATASHRLFVLAVDDSLSARRSLAQFAQDAGFEVRTARDGLEAIEIINGRRPDLVLADLEMPRMNGLELTAHLRANQATHELPVIMITSRSTEKHRREAETTGVNVYLTKPFLEDELLGHIHQLLRRA
ncbi:MAG: response regulator [Candidatus Contendobacter sp.]|nr:response regulator [Candidatus Contendobacter sp.]MDS4057910.1 response regulator [Candidatus Contendobacter sp.]